MLETSFSKILFALFVVASIAITIRHEYFRKCLSCGEGYLRLDEMKDSMGKNLGKKVTISIYKGPRKMTYKYKCNKCGNETVKKSWSWS